MTMLHTFEMHSKSCMTSGDFSALDWSEWTPLSLFSGVNVTRSVTYSDTRIYSSEQK